MENKPPKHVWEGVYADFAEAPAIGPGFDGDTWRQRSLAAARQTMDDIRVGRPIDYSMRQRNGVLAVLAAALLA